MHGPRLLAEYHRRHDEHDWSGLAALFAPRGELRFHGLPVRSERGPAAIERLLRERPPEDALVVHDVFAQHGGSVAASYAWRGSPDHLAGELQLFPDGDRIGRLDVYALPAPKRPRERTSARAVLVAPGPLILLFRCGEPGKDGWWWITPGGGHDPGEDDLATLRRELFEEVGVTIDAIGPCLWTRTSTFCWRDQALRQHERFFLVQVPTAVEPAPTVVDDGTLGHRWWTLDELDATDEILVPRRLAALVRSVLRHGPPAAPFDAGL